MLSYTLAKELKDAGFPQNRSYPHDFGPLPLIWVSPEGRIVDLISKDETCAYVPSLDELIEACGAPFDHLQKGDEHASWRARAWRGATPLIETGESMEEAVANLWLTLKKKDDVYSN